MCLFLICKSECLKLAQYDVTSKQFVPPVIEVSAPLWQCTLLLSLSSVIAEHVDRLLSKFPPMLSCSSLVTGGNRRGRCVFTTIEAVCCGITVMPHLTVPVRCCVCVVQRTAPCLRTSHRCVSVCYVSALLI